MDPSVQALVGTGISAAALARLAGVHRASASRWLQGVQPKGQPKVRLRRAARLFLAWPAASEVAFSTWVRTPADLLGGSSPSEWIKSDGEDGPLADCWIEASGASVGASRRAFPGRLAGGFGAFLAGADTASASWSAVSEAMRLWDPAVLSTFPFIKMPGVEAALAMSEPARYATELLNSVPKPYESLASAFTVFPLFDQLKTPDMSSLAKALPAWDTSLFATKVPDLLGHLNIELTGWFAELSRGFGADIQLAGAVAAALDAHQEVLPAFNREGTAFENWARARQDLPVTTIAELAVPASVVSEHATSRAALATSAPRWRDRADVDGILDSLCKLAAARLGLDREIPGSGLSLEEVLARHFPRTLEGLLGMVSTSNSHLPNSTQLAAFSFRDALRSFALELTGQPARGDPRSSMRR